MFCLLSIINDFYTVAVFGQTLATFVLPARNGEKLGTGTAGLLSYFFLFLLISTTMPQTSTNLPGLLIFFAGQISELFFPIPELKILKNDIFQFFALG